VAPRTFRRRAVVLVGAVVLGLTGCTSPSPRTPGTSDGAGVVGVALPSSTDAAWSDAGRALTEELRARGYRVDLQFAADDPRTQGSQVQNMLTKGADAVVLGRLTGDEVDGPVRAAVDGGVPVVAFGRAAALPGAGFVATADPAEIGRAQAEALLAAVGAPSSGGEAITDEGADASAGTDPTAEGETDASPTPSAPTPRLAVLLGVAADDDNAPLYDAARETLSAAVEAGEIEIVSGGTRESAAVTDDVADEEAMAAQRIDELRTADASPTAVLALGDAVTRGTVAALTATPDAPATPEVSAAPDASATPTPTATDSRTSSTAPIVAVGSGADDQTVAALRDGALAATVIVDVRALAVAAADAVDALLAEETPDGDGMQLPGMVGVPAFMASPLAVGTVDADRARDLQDGGAR